MSGVIPTGTLVLTEHEIVTLWGILTSSVDTMKAIRGLSLITEAETTVNEGRIAVAESVLHRLSEELLLLTVAE